VSWKEWTILIVVLGTVVGLQVMGHGGAEHAHGDGHADNGPAADAPRPTGATRPEAGAEAGMFRTVVLEVRGMT